MPFSNIRNCDCVDSKAVSLLLCCDSDIFSLCTSNFNCSFLLRISPKKDVMRQLNNQEA